MNRKEFIQSQGATCKNWTWSWSFVNHKERFVIFGAWDNLDDGFRAKILDENWKIAKNGRKSASYPQSLEHIHLVTNKGYLLKTFTMQYSDEKRNGKFGPAVIKGFIPELHAKKVYKEGTEWFAIEELSDNLPEEIEDPTKHSEGACKQITVNAYERDPDARRKCIEFYKPICIVCDFNFEKTYGTLGKGYIHVHHLIPLAKIKKQYELDPIKDLRPVCPNCHAMLHRNKEDSLKIDELKLLLIKNRN